MGRLLPPIDITSETQLGELDKRISSGPATLVLVYADWCGHCQRFKPTMEKLEKMNGRSIQTARIRDDMFPKSSISSSKIEGYPTLMLIDKNGKPTNFKNSNGQVSNAIPDHTDINKMTILVRNAGKPEGIDALSKASNATINTDTPVPTIPKNILADRLSESSVNRLNANLMNSSNSLVNESTKAVLKGGSSGGGLWSQLMIASKSVAPAAALFLGAEATRKNRGKKRRGFKKSRKVGRKAYT